MFANLKTVWKIFGAYRVNFVILVVLGTVGALFEGIGINITIPLLSFFTGGTNAPTDIISRTVHTVFTFFHITFTFRTLLILIVALFFARAVIVAGFTFIRGWLTADFLSTESKLLFRRLLEASWPFLLKQKMGHIHNTLVRDMQQTAALFEMSSQIIQSGTGFLMYFAVAFVISPLMTLVTFFGAATLILITRPLLRRTVQNGEVMSRTEKSISQFLSEHLIGMKLVKASGVAQEALVYSEKLLADLRAAYMRSMIARSISTSLFQPFALVFVVILFFIMYKSPGFSIVSFGATLYLIQKIFTYAESAQSSLHGVGQILPYLRNVAKFKEDLASAREAQQGSGEPFLFTKEITFTGVSFAYDQGKAIEGVSFSIKKGETVGLVGPSGAGKTSTADILLRLFVPQEGALLVDGVNANQISVDAWRRAIAYVPQEVFLFNASVEENVRFYRKEISEEDIVEALKQANIYSVVMNLPEGLKTHLGDRGVTLSGGQRQRIALARALAGKPQILVLDEATSALDAESEKLIQETLQNLHGEMTMCIIAHRLSTIQNADRVLVLDKGKLVEQGSPKEMFANPKSYLATHS